MHIFLDILRVCWIDGATFVNQYPQITTTIPVFSPCIYSYLHVNLHDFILSNWFEFSVRKEENINTPNDATPCWMNTLQYHPLFSSAIHCQWKTIVFHTKCLYFEPAVDSCIDNGTWPFHHFVTSYPVAYTFLLHDRARVAAHNYLWYVPVESLLLWIHYCISHLAIGTAYLGHEPVRPRYCHRASLTQKAPRLASESTFQTGWCMYSEDCQSRLVRSCRQERRLWKY